MEREARRGAPRSRSPKPPGNRQEKPTDRDVWTAHLMNGIRAQLRAAREGQGMTFDVLSERCTALGYPMSRVVLSKIEAGFRPDVSVPELLVMARALNVPPVQLLAPVGSSAVVEVLPGIQTSPWDASAWLSGSYLPEALSADLEPETGTPYSDRAEYVKRAFALYLYRTHRDLQEQWKREPALVHDMAQRMTMSRTDELELLMTRREPLLREIRSKRMECLRWGFHLPDIDADLAPLVQVPEGVADDDDD